MRPLLPGSPATDAGEDSAAPPADQRGIARPQLGSSDIGAFESRGFQLSVNEGDGQATGVGTDFPLPLSVTLLTLFGEPVHGGRITFTPPGSGPSCSIAGNPATISGTDAATGVVTANAIPGANYTVEATASGVTAAASFLLTNLEQADLAVSKSDSPDPVVAGQNLTYTIDFVNNGPDDADDVVVADAVPANATFVSAEVTTGSGWNIQAPLPGATGAVVFSKSVVASAETAIFTLVVEVDAATPHATIIESTVSASSSTNDSISGNDSSMASTSVVQPAIFSDGFESGDTSQWALTQPPELEEFASVAVTQGATRVSFEYDVSTAPSGRILPSRPFAVLADSSGSELFRIVARPGDAAETLEIRLEVAGSGTSAWVPVAATGHQLRFEWSVADASNLGHVAVFLDGGLAHWVQGFAPRGAPSRVRLYRVP
ncbi:MAG: choice-of-anchor Q domain-containing protein [Thermoanaerobaculia bacterium]